MHWARGLASQQGQNHPPPRDTWDTMGYGQRAGDKHPTEMHSCLLKHLIIFRPEAGTSITLCYKQEDQYSRNTKMADFLLLFLVAMVSSRDGVLCHSVVGIITDNTTWFLSNLSVRPAMTASLEYHVQYPYVDGRSRPIITFYYNGQNSPNLHSHCETDMYGQLRNEDLAVPLDKVYREKFFCYHDYETWYCSGKTRIQDFEPKSYSFSFSNTCKRQEAGNLNGLYYNVTIYDERNVTSCVRMGGGGFRSWRIDRCARGPQYAAIPNQIGGTDLDRTLLVMSQILGLLDQLMDLVSHRKCTKTVYQFVCDVMVPECLPQENRIILPCREACMSLLDECLGVPVMAVMVNKFMFSCDYLPSIDSNTTCTQLSEPQEFTQPFDKTVIITALACACAGLVVMVTVVTCCCVCCCKKKSKTHVPLKVSSAWARYLHEPLVKKETLK